jgi:serine/threonine protein kinase
VLSERLTEADVSDSETGLIWRQDDPDATVMPGAGTGEIPKPSVYPFLGSPLASGDLGRLGPYRVLRVLGQGRMGLVFQGEDVQLGRTVALKVMLPEVAAQPGARDRFLREARSAAVLDHDNIVAIYHVGEDEGVPYLVMPLLRGQTLDAYLRKGKPLTPAQVLRIARHVARGLAAAHDKGLIHRDVKPANLWLDASAGGRVKILDFGLARPIVERGERSELTLDDRSPREADGLSASGMIVGSPAYMAPEQINGQPEARSDLYSLGVVLYRLLAGRLPFAHREPLRLLEAACCQEPPALGELAPDAPRPLVELVMTLLAKRADDRPPTSHALLEELKSVERELIVVEEPEPEVSIPDETPTLRLTPSAPSSPRPRRKRPKSRPRLLIPVFCVVCVVVVLLCAALIGAHLRRRARAQPTEKPAAKASSDTKASSTSDSAKDKTPVRPPKRFPPPPPPPWHPKGPWPPPY